MATNGAASRAAAALALNKVLEQQKSLSQVFPSLTDTLESRDRALAQTICYGVLRVLPQLNFIIRQLLSKPLKKDMLVLHSLLLVGIYQLLYLRTSDHAAVAATVEATVLLKQSRQKSLINAILRTVQRQREQFAAQFCDHPELQHNHPRWLAELIQHHYPQRAEQIMLANNQQPPMWLRINEQRVHRDDYLALLAAANIGVQQQSPLTTAIQLLQPVEVQRLPHFAEGWVSVQDIAAQHAAWLLGAEAGEHILDCCAAPGGKTAHILERQPQAQLLAIDSDPLRLQRVHDNLQRLQLSARVQCADASDPASWWDGQLFDRILLDAPCSASGVIRRHPDIKWLRRASDIMALADLQQQILNALWSTLKPGGTLLYATCSIVPAENAQQVQAFLATHADAQAVSVGPDAELDWQWLPGDFAGDGFYYAKLEKRR